MRVGMGYDVHKLVEGRKLILGGVDIIILVAFSVVVWIFAATKKKISRKEGIAMVAMYLVYAVYIILR